MFAVFFAIVMRCIQVGAWQQMVDSVVHFYFGYAQVQTAEYWEEQSIDEALVYDSAMVRKIASVDQVRTAVPRLESFSLAAYEEQSRGALLIGVDPRGEDELTSLSTRVVKGEYLSEGHVLLTDGLADYLGVDVGDTAVFISQGYHGTNAAGKYPVSGIIHFPSPELNKQLAFLSLDDAQWFFGADGMATSIVIDPEDPTEVKQLARQLNQTLGTEEYVVKDFEELIPGLLQAKAFDEVGAFVILGVLYAIVGFGIFGTILMMFKERSYEFGVLKSIGMKSRELQGMLWMETLILSAIGCIAGIAIALPLVYYLHVNPIVFTGDMAEAYEKFGVDAVMPAAMDLNVFINQTLVILIMNSIMSLYPLISLRRLNPIQAMHE